MDWGGSYKSIYIQLVSFFSSWYLEPTLNRVSQEDALSSVGFFFFFKLG